MKLKLKKQSETQLVLSDPAGLHKPGGVLYREPKPTRNKKIEQPKPSLVKWWDLPRDGVSQSMIGLFALCSQKAHFKLIEGIESERSTGALDFGTFFHEALDTIYSQSVSNMGKPETKSQKEVLLHRLYTKKRSGLNDIKDEQVFEQTYGLADIVLEKYFKRWGHIDKNFTWIAVEQVFSFPYKLRDGTVIAIRGKFDGILRDKNGKLWLFETKTKSQIDGNHIIDKITFDLQVMVYMMAIKHVYKEDAIGVIYNLVKRPGQKYSGTYYKKPENMREFLERVGEDIDKKMDEYFSRYPISIRPEQVEDFKLKDLDNILERMYEWQQGGIGSYRNSGACSMWNRPCEFLSICANLHNRKNMDMDRFVKRLEVFPELNLPVVSGRKK